MMKRKYGIIALALIQVIYVYHKKLSTFKGEEKVHTNTMIRVLLIR